MLAWADRAEAIRPFVTDDARVVGHKLAQLETWVLFDELVVEHNALVALGPTDWLELTAGFTQGAVHSGARRGYSLTGPVLQAKALIWPALNNGRPGLALSAGALPPLGRGAFTPPGLGAFAFVALTESLADEAVLIHANVGGAFGDQGASLAAQQAVDTSRLVGLVTAGVGAQVRVVAGLHAVAEIYHADPYDPRLSVWASQAGFRYLFNDQVQIDATCGTTLTRVIADNGRAQLAQWATVGLRLVTPELW